MFDETEEQLRGLIAQGLKIDKGLIQRSSRLEDWGGDSLDFIDTLFAIERHFDISFPDTQGNQDFDFDTIARMVKEQIALKSQ
jgi:acyl carrier protein